MNHTWSIIIPVKPGGEVRALEVLKRIEYPRDLFEVIVSEGRRPSAQRNQAVESASGEYVYFLDDDSLVAPDVLTRAGLHYGDPQVAAAGGPSLTPRSDTPLQQAFGATLGSLIGGGSVRNRYRATGVVRSTGDHELILCNLSFRRQVFTDCGGLDERLYPNEENELMDRIRLKGWKLIHDPDLAVTRTQRKRYPDFVRQLLTYGRGRAEQTVITGRINGASLVPPLFIIYLLILPLLHNPVYTIPLLCYAGIVLVSAMYESLTRKMLSLFPLLLLTIPTLHLAYGAGMITGLFRPRFRNGAEIQSEVTLRRVTI